MRKTLATAVTVLALALAAPAFAEQPNDAWITAKVKTSLLTDDVVDGLRINVDTNDGRVVLYGRAASEQEKKRAEQRAREVQGVRDVENLLAVVPEAKKEKVEASDDQLKTAVSDALEKDAALKDSDVEVASVTNGVVVLKGDADTMAEERRAIARARGVAGVRRVESQIQAPKELSDREIWQAENEKGKPDSMSNAMADAWITTKVKVALLGEEGVNPARVNVDTRDGVVTLFGGVDSDAAKKRAASQAQSIDGVRRVENALTVNPDVAAAGKPPDDGDLTDAVEKRLDERKDLDDADIDVAASNGVVRLTGKVHSQADRLTALRVARGTPGVKSVRDDLQLEPAGATQTSARETETR